MVFLISMLVELHSGDKSVRTTRTANAARAYSIAKSHLSRQTMPITITMWDYNTDYNYKVATYVITDQERLDEAFKLMVTDVMIGE